MLTAFGKMETFCAFMISVCFFSKSSAYHISDSEAGRTTASTIVKEGLPAEIFCMVEGTGHYFWRKGESFNNSTRVASSTGDNGNKDNEPYVVKVNGTLFIKKVILKDEGKYFCRVTSVENECYGEVKVIVQASLRTFSLAIDRCDRESRCVLFLNPFQFIPLTCTAHNAPPLMTLKWFNGSKEITEGITKNEIIRQNYNSRELTSTVTAVYGHPASLTCQAVDPKRSNDDVMFAHAQVEMTVPAHETLPSWIIVSVTLVGCFIVFGIFLLIKATVKRKQRKKYTKLKTTEYKLLTTKVETKEEAINAKHLEVTKFKVSAESKDREISDLKTDLKKKDIEIKGKIDDISKLTETINDKDKMISVLREKDVENKSAIKSTLEIDKVKTTVSQAEFNKKESELSFLKREVKNKDKEIFALQMDQKKKDIEIKGKIDDLSKLMVDVKTKDKTISGLEDDVKAKDKTISGFDVDVKTKDEKISGLEATIEKKENELSVLKREVKNKDKAILTLQVNVKTNDNTISGLEVDVKTKDKKISGLEGDVKAKDKAIYGLKTDMDLKVIEVKEKHDKIQTLKDKLDLKDKELKEARKEKKADDKGRKGR